MKKAIKRLSSPVVQVQLISIIASLVVFLLPEKSELIERLVYTLTAIINVYAGLNNPTNKKGF